MQPIYQEETDRTTAAQAAGSHSLGRLVKDSEPKESFKAEAGYYGN